MLDFELFIRLRSHSKTSSGLLGSQSSVVLSVRNIVKIHLILNKCHNEVPLCSNIP